MDDFWQSYESLIPEKCKKASKSFLFGATPGKTTFLAALKLKSLWNSLVKLKKLTYSEIPWLRAFRWCKPNVFENVSNLAYLPYILLLSESWLSEVILSSWYLILSKTQPKFMYSNTNWLMPIIVYQFTSALISKKLGLILQHKFSKRWANY